MFAVRFWLRRYENIAKFNNSGLESYVGFARTYYFRRTYKGGGGRKHQTSVRFEARMSDQVEACIPVLDDTIIADFDDSRSPTVVKMLPEFIEEDDAKKNVYKSSRDMERMMVRSSGRFLSQLSPDAHEYRLALTKSVSQPESVNSQHICCFPGSNTAC